jgi:hypothetical protein
MILDPGLDDAEKLLGGLAEAFLSHRRTLIRRTGHFVWTILAERIDLADARAVASSICFDRLSLRGSDSLGNSGQGHKEMLVAAGRPSAIQKFAEGFIEFAILDQL